MNSITIEAIIGSSMQLTTNIACYTYYQCGSQKEGISQMLQQSTRATTPRPILKPKRLDIFLHATKTVRLLATLIREPRIPVIRKALFLSSVTALLLVLLFPDVLDNVILGTILPFVGVFLGVPVDAGVDWVAFSLLVVSLLRFFPEEIVSEHYSHIFEK
jgi:hypothetical protein